MSTSILSTSRGGGDGVRQYAPKRSTLERSVETYIKRHKLLEPEAEYAFAPPRKFRFDFAWPHEMVALECEGGTFVGGRHGRGPAFHNDCIKYNMATNLGWRVFRVDAKLVADEAYIVEMLAYALR